MNDEDIEHYKELIRRKDTVINERESVIDKLTYENSELNEKLNHFEILNEQKPLTTVDIPDKDILQESIKVLQKIMKIQDWDIDVELVSGREMVNKYPDDADYNTQAMSDRNLRRNYALISINKENVCDVDENWYDTLVHELLHVQETEYLHAVESYMSENGTFFQNIHEQYIDKLQKMFKKIYPLQQFMKDNPEIFKANKQ